MTNPANGRSVVVRVNDRGPFIRHREFDISLGAAKVLEIVEDGVATLIIQRICA